MVIFWGYLLIGACAGLISGLVGIGGGVIIVPALTWLYLHQQVPADAVMYVAVATSITTIVFTNCSSAWVHYQRHAIRWPVVTALLPGLAIGALLGAWTTRFVPTELLVTFFSLILFVTSIRLLVQRSGGHVSPQLLGSRYLPLLGVFVGSTAAMLGLGGGIVLVPTLQYCHYPLRDAVAISSVASLATASLATLGHMFFDAHEDVSQLNYMMGYVHWEAVLGIVMTSLCCAHVGARLVHYLPEVVLRQLFACIMLLISLNMLRVAWLAFIT